LRRAGHQPGGNAGAEDAESEQRQRRQHKRHRLTDIRLLHLQRGDEMVEEARADADDHRQHHHLDARRDDVAQHPLGQKGGLAPQRERHQHEPGQRGQLEFQHGDEQLHRQDEEGDDHDQPGDQQHGDGEEIVEEAGEAHQGGDLSHFPCTDIENGDDTVAVLLSADRNP